MARLNPYGRELLCRRIEAGQSIRAAARTLGISHTRAAVLWRRYLVEGATSFALRSSRPHRSPRLTPAHVVRRIERRRHREREGPRMIAWVLHLPRSTVYAVLRRLGISRLRLLDQPARERFHRYERARPGELLHLDTKKLGRVPSGGGKRFWEIKRTGHRSVGHEVIHLAVDDRTRVQYSERLRSDDAPTTAAFLARALDHFATLGIRVQAVMTDNHWSYAKSAAFRQILASRGIRHLFIPAYTPRVNGKAEAFVQILLRRWAYKREYRSNRARSVAFVHFGHSYNHRRPHGEIGMVTPMQRLAADLGNKVHGQNT